MGLAKSFLKYFLIIMLLSTSISYKLPSFAFPIDNEVSELAIESFTFLPADFDPDSQIGDCLHPAFTFIDCDDYNPKSKTHVADITIAVIDDGLVKAQWEFLEQNPYARADIVRYVTKNKETGNLEEYGKKGLDNPIPDPPQSFEVQHGFAMVFALATIYRHIKVVFIDMKTNSEDTQGFEKPFDGNTKIWDWLLANHKKYGINIISMSAVYRNSFAQHEKIVALHNAGILLISPTGNFNHEYNWYYLTRRKHFYPQLYLEWYAIGSVDHSENRYPGERSIFCSGVRSEACNSGSSWGSASWSADSVDFVMPGNMVPSPRLIYSTSEIEWVAPQGTSFSAPYFAATIAIIMDRFAKGLQDACGYISLPTKEKILQILKLSSSRTTFDKDIGWGWISLIKASTEAYHAGNNPGYCFTPW
ncbi:MAG: hypothetical protein D6732_11250 [Methanobacteriota archaeon]|nr:MAG: hypothetical protein D6732_11250 [Euryarchaeota archaeon]